MFSATVRVGARVSSWLIATMPCSIACRGSRSSGLAVDPDRPGVGLLGAVEDLDERRLARPVLAREGVHLSWEQLEVDPVQSDNAGKALPMPSIRTIGSVTEPRQLAHRLVVAALARSRRWRLPPPVLSS